jgi:hypothetical protein
VIKVTAEVVKVQKEVIIDAVKKVTGIKAEDLGEKVGVKAEDLGKTV